MTHSGSQMPIFRRGRRGSQISVIFWLVAVPRIRNVIYSVIRWLDVIRWDTTDIFGRWSSCSLHPHRILAGYAEHQHRSHATYVPLWAATNSNCLQAAPLARASGVGTFLMGSRLWFFRMEFGGLYAGCLNDAAGFSEASLFVILYRSCSERSLSGGRKQFQRRAKGAVNVGVERIRTVFY